MRSIASPDNDEIRSFLLDFSQLFVGPAMVKFNDFGAIQAHPSQSASHALRAVEADASSSGIDQCNGSQGEPSRGI